MFWPPSFTPNNTVTITDSKFVLVEEEEERFEPFTQSACILAPWLARTDQDTRWTPGDAMMRIILIGDPAGALFSFNSDGHGSILRLGSPPASTQLWEVVSYFDWFLDGEAGKVGAFAFCRLWQGEVEDPPPPEPPPNIGDNLEHGEAFFGDPGAFFWMVPEGVSAVEVYAWGAGGGGEDTTTLDNGGGAGGGAGAFAFFTFEVTPGVSISLFVGAYGVPGLPGTNGGPSIFQGGTQLTAAGGNGGGSVTLRVGGLGGLADDCVGSLVNAGGDGGDGQVSPNGGAGAGGGSGGDGSPGGPGGDGIGTQNGDGGAAGTGAHPGAVGIGGNPLAPAPGRGVGGMGSNQEPASEGPTTGWYGAVWLVW